VGLETGADDYMLPNGILDGERKTSQLGDIVQPQDKCDGHQDKNLCVGG